MSVEERWKFQIYPPCLSQESSSSCQVWQQLLSSVKPSHRPFPTFFLDFSAHISMSFWPQVYITQGSPSWLPHSKTFCTYKINTRSPDCRIEECASDVKLGAAYPTRVLGMFTLFTSVAEEIEMKARVLTELRVCIRVLFFAFWDCLNVIYWWRQLIK